MVKQMFTSLRRLEAETYLPAARVVLSVAALLCALGGATSLLVAGYFDASSRKTAAQVALPPEYESKSPVIDLGGIRAALIGPANIRFEVFRSPVSSAEEAAAALGRLLADARNGLAKSPDDFELLGGPDSEYFERVDGLEGRNANPASARNAMLRRLPQFTTGLAATEKFLELLREAQATGEVKTRQFEIRIRARDSLGNTSPPQSLIFQVSFGPAPTAAAPQPLPQPVKEPAAEPTPAPQTPLEMLAREIALSVDPERGADFVDVRARALQVPQQCGSSPGDPAFLSNYDKAFRAAKSMLTAANVSRGFFPSVCQAWRAALAVEQQAASAAQAARQRAEAANERLRGDVESANADKRERRNRALISVLASLAGLLLLSLPIGLLLIERHSRAMHRIVERLEAANIRHRATDFGEKLS